jgi:hypothetical protein
MQYRPLETLTGLLSAYLPAIRVILLAAGALKGLLAGLLGIGGEVGAVPVLIEISCTMGLGRAAPWRGPWAQHRPIF